MEEEMQPKTFLFVGLIMLGVSLIILTVVIFYPSTQIRDYPQHQKRLNGFTSSDMVCFKKVSIYLFSFFCLPT
jgi:Na+/melibiose symporter-like transporter